MECQQRRTAGILVCSRRCAVNSAQPPSKKHSLQKYLQNSKRKNNCTTSKSYFYAKRTPSAREIRNYMTQIMIYTIFLNSVFFSIPTIEQIVQVNNQHQTPPDQALFANPPPRRMPPARHPRGQDRAGGDQHRSAGRQPRGGHHPPPVVQRGDDALLRSAPPLPQPLPLLRLRRFRKCAPDCVGEGRGKGGFSGPHTCDPRHFCHTTSFHLFLVEGILVAAAKCIPSQILFIPLLGSATPHSPLGDWGLGFGGVTPLRGFRAL